MAKVQSEYNRKRDFERTSEPREPSRTQSGKAGALRFVVQKHDARHLHYDFRLELNGTLKSWAVPKGPSLDPRDKRLAVHVEDHPLDYAGFEGSIPHGNYGAGDVIVWDHGVWQPHDDPAAAYAAGKLKFSLIGEKLSGDWALVRTRLRGSGDKQQWLLIKERDDRARPSDEYNIVEAQPQSVISGALVGGLDKTAKRKPTDKSAVGRKTHPEFPESLAPQLATLADRPPEGEWLYEVKFDGYRMLARIHDGEVRLFTRNGHDWTERLPQQAKALSKLTLTDSWLDGEIVALNEDGLPDFQQLQNAFEIGRSHDLIYYLFDAPFLNGEDLRQIPLEERRAKLKRVLGNSRRSPLRFSAAFTAHHADIVESACAMSLEGVIGKRAGSTYVSRRSADWIKLKCRLRQEFVIVGYTKPQGSRSGFGALLLAVNEPDGLHYAGRVGTGFDDATLKALHQQLQTLKRSASPLSKKLTSTQARGVSWVEPQRVAEVEFAEWTRDDIVRHASFIALRTDKPADQIVRERPVPIDESKAEPKPGVEGSSKAAAKPVVAGVQISNPQRVIDPQSDTSKLQVAQFYQQVADWLLPYLDNRPVALLRAPEGIAGEQFFQKHAEHLAIPNIKQLDQKLDPGHARLMEIDTVSALVGAVQMGCIEFHTWGANSNRIETPDHFVLDLDPDPALPWRSMLEATHLTLSLLDELGLQAFIKTSGGKGIHIVVPLARRAHWDAVKGFAKAIAQFMSRQLPERFTATSGPKNRVGKIFIDYLRNGRGASTVTPYSLRARPGLPVSVPIARDELDDLRSAQQWTVRTLQQRLNHLHQDPWQGYANRQRLTLAMWKRLGAQPPDPEKA
ncbi:DNA ligase D [Pseudomonas sp. EL_65y_Pfl2_R95]|uniref:DNA ligase D n=1 Tax=Pseudomonas sp. EL_65y_Pfl2_R95 TaxID=3088698 RepID=UPI0030DB9325